MPRAGVTFCFVSVFVFNGLIIPGIIFFQVLQVLYSYIYIYLCCIVGLFSLLVFFLFSYLVVIGIVLFVFSTYGYIFPTGVATGPRFDWMRQSTLTVQ